MKKKKVGGVFGLIFAIFVIGCLVLTASSYGLLPFKAPSWESVLSNTAEKDKSAAATAVNAADTLNAPDAADVKKSTVHFVDCWQGDCEVIQSDGCVTVIDAGPKKYAERTYEYIKNLGITKIDNLVLTHAHEDHIGGAVKLINSFEIGKIYMSRPKSGTEPTTAVYKNLLKAVAAKNMTITTAKAGMSFEAGKFKVNILSPSKDYDELNDQSVVLHAVYDNVSFLFTGDTETEPCNDMLKNSKGSLKSTVLKVGHHGSKTSNSANFLKAISPAYAVISCGEGNTYGHPQGAVLDRLSKVGAEVYRTDLQGSITMTTNGQSINVNVEKAAG